MSNDLDENVELKIKLNILYARIEAREAALRQIIDWYEDHNINHVDFRVMTCHRAMDALEEIEHDSNLPAP